MLEKDESGTMALNVSTCMVPAGGGFSPGQVERTFICIVSSRSHRGKLLESSFSALQDQELSQSCWDSTHVAGSRTISYLAFKPLTK